MLVKLAYFNKYQVMRMSTTNNNAKPKLSHRIHGALEWRDSGQYEHLDKTLSL